jgi:hypothetical protein
MPRHEETVYCEHSFNGGRMSLLDKGVAAVTPPESDENRRASEGLGGSGTE